MKTILVDAFNTFVIEDQGIFKEMHNLLEQYPNPKIILTNANDDQIEKLGLTNMPYPLFTLKHNPEKTEPAYFEKMLNHFQLESDKVLYFEHNPEAVKSAESAGILSYHYDAEAKDIYKLKDFLDQSI